MFGVEQELREEITRLKARNEKLTEAVQLAIIYTDKEPLYTGHRASVRWKLQDALTDCEDAAGDWE